MACVFLFQFFTAIPQPLSIDPWGLAYVAVVLVAIGFCICSPVALISAWFAHRNGAKQEASLSLSAAKLVLMPLFILYATIVLIVLLTGVQLGS